MGRKFRYLGPVERAEIERLYNGGVPAAVIAKRVRSHVATIYHELPNGYTGAVDEYGRRVYSAEVAQRTFERNIKRRAGRGKLTGREITIPPMKYIASCSPYKVLPACPDPLGPCAVPCSFPPFDSPPSMALL